MKVNNLEVEVYVCPNAAPDSLNHTVVWSGDSVIWPTMEMEFDPLHLWGNPLKIQIPSGELWGQVTKVEEVQPSYDFDADGTPHQYRVRLSQAYWSGLAGGLAGGRFACGDFRVIAGGLVYESSTLPWGAAVSYEDYERVRDACSIFENKQEMMQQIFARAMASCGPLGFSFIPSGAVTTQLDAAGLSLPADVEDEAVNLASLY